MNTTNTTLHNELSPSSYPEYWEESYLSGEMGWDLGGPTPVFKAWIKTEKSPLKICILGAGNGWDAIEFAQSGHEVTAVDFAESAVNNLKKTADENVVEIDIIHSDIFNLESTYYNTFDIVLEYTCFCAIDPSLRKNYIQLVNSLLKTGGRFVGLLFPTDKLPEEGGPPFAVNIDETIKIFKKFFTLEKRQEHELSVSPRKGREEFIILRKHGYQD
ncbi:MAG: methyltransferase domain-containing protein [Candidatus Marinimicrobia bacterium]|jgi:SAM-dependent methyltransferase|nr:methyltransferase domain-containing protein [Candidatus Neomarinimicrobiota bacterium]